MKSWSSIRGLLLRSPAWRKCAGKLRTTSPTYAWPLASTTQWSASLKRRWRQNPCASGAGPSSCWLTTARAARPTPCGRLAASARPWPRKWASAHRRSLAALEQKVLLQSPELDQRPLPAEAPNGPASVPLSGALPHPASSFVGRVEEVAKVARLVGERRLVTLAGAGGCGKTRLAQEVAATVAGRFPEGAHFVALAPLADPASVPLAVAEALGVRPLSGRPITQVVAEVVGHRETLIVVDNCEHLVGAVAELVEDLLQGAPGLRVLATSREPLRISAESVWRVPSLEVPAAGASVAECRGCGAVELFVDRAQAARPGAARRTTAPLPPLPRSPAASTACPLPSNWRQRGRRCST